MKQSSTQNNEFKLTSLKKNKSDKAWVNRHATDHYVQKAKIDGYRSRAAYKLLEIDNSYKILSGVKNVIDLGSAPGSWSQIARTRIPPDGKLLSVDLLPMAEIPNVNFIQGDFTQNEVLEQILIELNGKMVDLIISDMAPNISGIKSVDQAKSSYLIELVLDFASLYLKTGGNCLMKIFIGGEFQKSLIRARGLFEKVNVEKPDSSRSESSETYLLCKNKW